MIKIEYEKYRNDYDKVHLSQTFNSLKDLEEWMFGLLKQPASADYAMYFPKKDNIGTIQIHPSNGSLIYWIHSIYYNGSCVFTDGLNATGQKFMATAIDKWLEHCRERRFAKQEFIDISEIE